MIEYERLSATHFPDDIIKGKFDDSQSLTGVTAGGRGGSSQLFEPGRQNISFVLPLFAEYPWDIYFLSN